MKLLIQVSSGVGGDLRSTDDFQSVMETSLSQNTFLVKFSWRYDLKLSSGQVQALLVAWQGLHSTDDFQL